MDTHRREYCQCRNRRRCCRPTREKVQLMCVVCSITTGILEISVRACQEPFRHCIEPLSGRRGRACVDRLYVRDERVYFPRCYPNCSLASGRGRSRGLRIRGREGRGIDGCDLKSMIMGPRNCVMKLCSESVSPSTLRRGSGYVL